MAESDVARPRTCVQADEEWRVNPRFPNYEVSSLGRVRRLTTVTSGKAGTILKAAKHYGGYRHHGLCVGGGMKTVRLNRLVCETFHGPAPSPSHVAAHNDSDIENYRADNLRWATQTENEADKTMAGRRPLGSRLKSPLTERDIREIRASRETKAVQAAKYGVTANTIGNVRAGRTWKHVT